MAEANRIGIPPRVKDITGRHFGRWKVIGFSGTAHRDSLWLCECKCGTRRRVSGGSLRNGSLSCDCWNLEVVIARNKARATHRMGKSREYRAWSGMRDRCLNRKGRDYPRWGGRGIKICGRWSKFENFLADMGPCPRGREIDRIDNDGDYGPDNCRWATKKQQQGNKRTTVMLAHQGQRRCMSAWAKILGVEVSTIRKRLKNGWSVERALSAPA